MPIRDTLRPVLRQYPQLRTRYDPENGVAWRIMDPSPRPSFTHEVLDGLLGVHDDVREIARLHWGDDPWASQIRYLVVASAVPGVYNLGGDLHLFYRLIRDQDRNALQTYATKCVQCIHDNVTNLDLPLTTIGLVQGDALGGGCECALSSSVVIAEEQSTFGLPEVMFNLFPGMGAYHLLARRVGTVQAEEIITSRKIYTAKEFHAMGLVDILVPEGDGDQAVADYARQHSRRRNALRGVLAIRQEYHPVHLEDLLRVTKIWVESALRLSEKDLRVMRRLIGAQDRGMETRSPSEDRSLAAN